jgi:putative transposase
VEGNGQSPKIFLFLQVFHTPMLYNKYVKNMKQIITAKLKLIIPSKDKNSLLSTIVAFKEAMNYLLKSNYNDKSSNVKTIHSKHYHALREQFHLPSQLSCSVERLCADITKTMWSRFKSQNNKAILKTIPKYKQLTAKYTLNRDITIKTDKMECSITTLNGRLKNIYLKGWEKHYEQIKNGRLCDPQITYDQSKKNFYLLLPIELKIEEKQHKQIVGIDAGQRCALTCVSDNEVKEYDIPETIRRRKTKISKLRGDLQSKGTRSAKRKLESISKRERRLISDVSHCISKQVVSDFQDAQLILEDLTGIRNRTKTFRRSKENRRQVEQWNYFELQHKIGYKSIIYNGIESLKINPAYTSQTCPKCFHISEENRPNGSEIFHCVNCEFEEKADIIAGMNIRLKGLFVNQPIVRVLTYQNLGTSCVFQHTEADIKVSSILDGKNKTNNREPHN